MPVVAILLGIVDCGNVPVALDMLTNAELYHWVVLTAKNSAIPFTGSRNATFCPSPSIDPPAAGYTLSVFVPEVGRLTIRTTRPAVAAGRLTPVEGATLCTKLMSVVIAVADVFVLPKAVMPTALENVIAGVPIVGLVPKTNAPVPVSSVITADKLELVP